MANGMILLPCQDLVFDTACSNLISTIPYNNTAEVAKYRIHTIFAVAAYNPVARYFLQSLSVIGEGLSPPFGYSSLTCAGPWGPFCIRYRGWEPCVKYVQLEEGSQDFVAKFLHELVSAGLMLKDYDIEKAVGEELARAMKSDAYDLVSRPVARYFVSVSESELFGVPGTTAPTLCCKCALNYLRRNHG